MVVMPVMGLLERLQRRLRAADVARLERLADAGRTNPQLEVQLRADRRVPYGDVAQLIGLMQKAGLSRIGFVTEPGTP